jgi:hypothetical protein
MSAKEVFIDGIRYVPDPEYATEIRVYYMHDNHTFTRLTGKTLNKILQAADKLAVESPCGMLCSPVVMANGKEIRRLKVTAHAPCCGNSEKWVEGKAAWLKECRADQAVMRLLGGTE